MTPFSELKKRQKLREKKKKDEEKAAKKKLEEEKKKEEGKEPGKGKKKNGDEEEELDPTKYRENRINWLEEQRKEGKNPYPHKFQKSHRNDEFFKEYDPICVEKDAFLEDKEVSLTGRVMKIRGGGASAKLIFMDLVSDDTKIQIMSNLQFYTDGDNKFVSDHLNIRRGDIVGIVGNPGRTKTG